LDEKDKAEKNFLKQFNDYDQTVDVVSCWHALSDFLFKESYFFRFGKFRTKEKIELTPDFALAESKNGKVASLGSLVCDVKKFPNPYPDLADPAEQETAYKVFGSSVEEVFKYGVPLSYISDHGKLPKLVFEKHDVVLLTPEEIVDSVYKYLVSRLGVKPFNVGRPLVLVSYYYNQAEQLERYVFKWKQGESNSPFSNPVLADKMVAKSQPLTVYPRRFLEYKIRHVLCNDSPPPIYLIVFIWVEVLLKFLSPDEIELWQSTGSTRIREIELTPQQLHRKLCDEYFAPFALREVKRALDTLCDIKKAVLKDRGKELYAIQFYNLANRVFTESPGEQQGLAERSKQREYGRLFAQLLARKEIAPPPVIRRAGFRRSKMLRDYPKLPFPETT
jgi:hypothetical protein